MPLFKRWLVFPQIHVRRGTGTEDLQNTFCLWGVMRLADGACAVCYCSAVTDQLGQRDTGERRRDVAQKPAARKIR